MQMSVARRVVWLLLSIWLMPALVAPELMNACPSHHLHSAATAGHGAHRMPVAGREPSTATHQHPTCLERCCAAVVADVTRKDPRITSQLRLVTSVVQIGQDHARAQSFAVLLPPSTGPPPRA